MTLYTFDDPSLSYDEKCFFYQGEFDPNCSVSSNRFDDPRIKYDEKCYFYNGPGYDPLCGLDTNLFNDPRLGYDEKCYFYNGPGYDEKCLLEPEPVIIIPDLKGRTSFAGSRRRLFQSKQHLPWLDISIEVCLEELNFEKVYFDCAPLFKFKGENEDISVQISGALFEGRFPAIRSEIVRTETSSKTVVDFIEVLQPQLSVDTRLLSQNSEIVVEVQNNNHSEKDYDDSSLEVSAILIESRKKYDE